MGMHHPVHHSQTQAGSVSVELGGEKRLKHALLRFRQHAHACVDDTKTQHLRSNPIQARTPFSGNIRV
jgi:hypothetical protein